MLNPDYSAKVSNSKPQEEIGSVIYCPKCKKPLMEGHILVILTRCKHCKHWVYLAKRKK